MSADIDFLKFLALCIGFVFIGGVAVYCMIVIAIARQYLAVGYGWRQSISKAREAMRL